MVLGVLLALLALADSTGKALIGYVLQAGVIVRELAIEILEGIPQVLGDRLLNGDLSTFCGTHTSILHSFYLLSRDNYQTNPIPILNTLARLAFVTTETSLEARLIMARR